MKERARIIRPAQQRSATQALAEILTLKEPADNVLRALFRRQPQLGANDRRAIGDVVYGVLRNYRRLEVAVGSHPDHLVEAFLSGKAGENLDPAQRLNLPDWLYDRLAAAYGAQETEALGAALNAEAPVDLRVNLLLADRPSAQLRLAAEGLSAARTPLSPWGLRLAGRVALPASPAYREGWIEPQDEGSQLIAALVAPSPGESVIDWCAGAGGKTLALGALMRNDGALLACDISRARLARLPDRARRAGISIARTHVLDGEEPLADAVLVDAPCSSTGRLRRNPELRLHTPNIAALQELQREILRAAARCVRPGGRLVYASCSLLPDENEDVVAAFLDSHLDYRLEDAGEALAGTGVSYQGKHLRLLPHTHGTDGFFGCRLQRRGKL